MGRHQSSGPPDRSRCVAGPDHKAADRCREHHAVTGACEVWSTLLASLVSREAAQFPSGRSRSHSSTLSELALRDQSARPIPAPNLTCARVPTNESTISLTSLIAQFGWFPSMLLVLWAAVTTRQRLILLFESSRLGHEQRSKRNAEFSLPPLAFDYPQPTLSGPFHKPTGLQILGRLHAER
jgi:hypothetical protein